MILRGESEDSTAKPLTWTTFDGEVIPVKEMELDHMHRRIHHVARRRAVGLLMVMDAVDALRYAADAPDGAADAASSEADQLLDEAYSTDVTELRIEYAIKHSKAIAAMACRLKKAGVDYTQPPPPYDPARAERMKKLRAKRRTKRGVK